MNLIRNTIAALLAAFALAAAAPAQAETTHVFEQSFVPAGVSQPTAVAVDESSDVVYVLDVSTGAIGKYDLAGNPVDFSALGEPTLASGCGNDCNQIAVDNSGGPNEGVIYVSRHASSSAQRQIHVFLSSGRAADPIANATETDSSTRFCGVATDAVGHVFVGHNNGLLSANYTPRPDGVAYVDRFKPGPWLRAENPIVQQWPVTGVMFSLSSSVAVDGGNDGGNGASCRLAATAAGDLYFSSYSETSPSESFGRVEVRKASAGSFDSLPGPPLHPVDAGSTYFAVDPASDDVYFDHEDAIVRRDSANVTQETFGADQLEKSYGVAVDGDSGTVFATDAEAGTVSTFGAVVTPDVEASATAGQTTASLSGHVGLAGAGDVTDCEFEWGLDESYGEVEPCAPDASGSAFEEATDVSASLSGLAKETTYHYRIAAANANGTTRGPDRAFTTHNVTALTSDAPTQVTQTTATLNGSFEGNGEPTNHYFQWGPTSAYGNETALEPAGSPAGHKAVSAPIEGLSVYLPDSEPYHFRLVASNGSGTTYGPDRTFFAAPPDLPGLTGSAAATVGLDAATLSATVNSGGGDTLYLFEYGANMSYGASTPVSGPVGQDSSAHRVSSRIDGLAPGTTYHFRAVGINFGGTSYGPDTTFTTLAPSAPRIPAAALVVPLPAASSTTNNRGCATMSRRAARLSGQARRLRLRADRAASHSASKAAALRRRAGGLAKKAGKLTRQVRACRGSSERSAR